MVYARRAQQTMRVKVGDTNFELDKIDDDIHQRSSSWKLKRSGFCRQEMLFSRGKPHLLSVAQKVGVIEVAPIFFCFIHQKPSGIKPMIFLLLHDHIPLKFFVVEP
jgi:hypothetical protein